MKYKIHLCGLSSYVGVWLVLLSRDADVVWEPKAFRKVHGPNNSLGTLVWSMCHANGNPFDPRL